MKSKELDPDILARILRFQQGELNEYHTYANLAKLTKDKNNRRILEKISADELRHYLILQNATGKEFTPNGFRIRFFSLLGSVLELSFALRLMEKGRSLI